MTSGLRQSYRVEVSKLAAQLPVRLVLLLCLVGPFAFVAVVRVQQTVPADTLFGRWVHTSGFAVPLVALGFAGSWALPLATSLVAGDIFASEDRHGTWKTILTRSCTRAEIFWAKLLAVATYVVSVVALLTVSSLVAGVTVIGTQSLVSLSGTMIPASRCVWLVVASWASALLPMLGFACVAVLVSIVSRSSVVGVLVPAVLGLVMQLLSLVGRGEIVRTLLLTTPFDAWHGLFVAHRFYRPLVEGAIVSFAYGAVCIEVAWVLFRLRDVAGAGAGRGNRRTPLLVAATAALVAIALGIASDLGPTGITPTRLAHSITPTFENLVLLQQQEVGRRIPHGDSLNVVPTCRRTSGVRSVGPGDDWLCSLDVISPAARQLSLGYEVNVRANGCYTAEGPPTVIGRLTLRTTAGHHVVNPLYEFDGCFET
jgi:ABC-2 type transport system permease protein